MTERKTESEARKPLLEPKEKREIKPIPLAKLFVGELNERIDVGDLTGLTASIKQVGILEPLLARPVGDKFEIIYGRRRFEAAKNAGLPYAPCQIQDMNDVEALHASYAENEQRQSATPMEQGYQCYKLLQRIQDIKEVATLLGKTPIWVKSRIEAYELHKVTSAVITAKGPGGITEGIGATGIGLADATIIHGALRSKSVDRYLGRQPEDQRSKRRGEIAKDLVESIRTIEPAKRGKLITEFKKDPSQDMKALAEKISHEPRPLKLSIYLPAEVAPFVEELSEKAGLAPQVWVYNVVVNQLRTQGCEIPSLKDLMK